MTSGAGRCAITSCVPLRVGLIVALLLAFATPAVAAPELEVHARTEIRLKPIRKDYGDIYVISGTLVDRFSGAPIAGELVTLRLAGNEVSAETDYDGTFSMRVPAPGSGSSRRPRISPDSKPNPTTRAFVCAAMAATRASSRFSSAMPSAGSAATSRDFSAATASTPPRLLK